MLLRTLSVAALTSLAAAQSPTTQPRSLEDLLPASTYAAARFGGLDACTAATGRAKLAELVAAFVQRLPEQLRDELLERGLGDAADELRHELEQVGLRPADLRDFLRRPMALAVGRLSIEGMGPSVALLIEEGEHKQAITRALRAGLGVIARQMPDRGAGVTMEKTEVAGVPVYHVRLADGPPLFAGSIGGSYCVTNSRGYLAEIARVAAGEQPSLAQAAGLGALRQQLPAQPIVSWLANTRLLMDSLAPHLPYEAGQYADALGLGRVDLVYAASTATASGGADLFHVAVGGDDQGVFKALGAQPADLSFAHACSADTVLFSAGSFDVPALLAACQRFVALLPDEAQRELRGEFLRELGRELRHVGMSTLELGRLLRAFGGQVGLAVSVDDGPVPKPELLVRLSVTDPEPIRAAMVRLEALIEREADVTWNARRFGDHEVRSCGVRLPGSGVQLTPCYAIVDGGLWIGSDAVGLGRALKRREAPDESLAAQEDFRRVQQQAADTNGVMHLRLFRGVEIGWRSVETMLYPLIDARADELGFDSDALPEREELAAALGSTTWYYRVDENGVTARCDGLFALGSLLAAFGALGDEVLDRATGRVF